MTAPVLVRGACVYTADGAGRIYPDGSVLIVDGRIRDVGERADVDARLAADPVLGSTVQVIEADAMMVLPGFVNPHWHENFARQLRQPGGARLPIDDRGDGPTLFARGGDVGALTVTLDNLYSLGAELTSDEATAIATYSLWTQLRCGTTTFGDVGSNNRPEALIAATRRLGVRGTVSVWASDTTCPPGEQHARRTRDTDEVLNRIEGLLADCATDTTGRVRAMPSAIYAPNMSDELGAGMRDLASRFDTPVATHIGALRNEAAVSRTYFGSSSIERFDALGLLSSRLIAVHCAFADEADRRRLVESRVHVNHSPAKYGIAGESTISETRLIVELMQAGLSVSLSTDGLAYPIGAMPEAMTQAWLMHNEAWADNTVVRPSTALQMATRAGAQALQWDDRIGSIEVGKCGDLVLIPINDWRYLLRPRPLEAFLAIGGSADVDTVIVDGRVLVRHGEPTMCEEDELRRNYLDALITFERRSGVISRDELDRLITSGSPARRGYLR